MAVGRSTVRLGLQDEEYYPHNILLQRADSDELAEYKHKVSPPLSKTGEEPKAALKKSYPSLLLHSLIHLPSIVITIGVLSLTFRSVFWQAPGPNTNSVLNALQFAAKLHESLIIVSLCSIVLYHLRRALIGSRGLPLGLLGSAFQLNSAAYVFSGEFWGGAAAKSQPALQRIPLVMGILTAFALANFAAPSSAITMIPRLDWWPLRELYPRNQVTFSAYLQAANSSIFPEAVTKAFLPEYCFGQNATLRSECPSGGLPALMATAGFLSDKASTQWQNGYLPTTNITMSFPNNQAMRFLGGSQLPINQGNNTVYAASSIPDFLASAMMDYYLTVNAWTTGGISLLVEVERPLLQLSLKVGNQVVTPHKPAVQVECGAMPFGVSDIVFPHNLFVTTPWTDDAFLNAEWSIPSSAVLGIAVNDESGKANFTWVDLGGSQNPRPSLAGVFTTPKFNSEAGLDNAIYACTVAANWIPTEPWIDPLTDIFIHEALPQPFTDLAYDITGPGGPIPAYSPLFIDIAWANSLNVKFNGALSNQTAIEALASACATSTGSGTNTTAQSADLPDMAMSQCLEMGLALYITDGLSRTHSSINRYFVANGPGLLDSLLTDVTIQELTDQVLGDEMLLSNITLADLQDPANYTEFHFEVLRYGYGFGFRGILIYIAVVVLLVHVALALTHMGLVLMGGSFSSAWSTMGEMLVLAINSSSTEHLGNTCAGVSQKETWGLVTRVREMSDHRVELVFEENDKEDGQPLQQVKDGKKYG